MHLISFILLTHHFYIPHPSGFNQGRLPSTLYSVFQVNCVLSWSCLSLISVGQSLGWNPTSWCSAPQWRTLSLTCRHSTLWLECVRNAICAYRALYNTEISLFLADSLAEDSKPGWVFNEQGPLPGGIWTPHLGHTAVLIKHTCALQWNVPLLKLNPSLRPRSWLAFLCKSSSWYSYWQIKSHNVLNRRGSFFPPVFSFFISTLGPPVLTIEGRGGLLPTFNHSWQATAGLVWMQFYNDVTLNYNHNMNPTLTLTMVQLVVVWYMFSQLNAQNLQKSIYPGWLPVVMQIHERFNIQICDQFEAFNFPYLSWFSHWLIVLCHQTSWSP